MTPSIWDVCTKKLVLTKFNEAVNLIIKLFFPDQTAIPFFLLLRFFSRKIEVWEPENHKFQNYNFFSENCVNFISEWRWPENNRCGICFKIIKYWKYEKLLYFDHVTTKNFFHNFFFHFDLYYSPPRSFRIIHPLFL